MRIRRIRWRRLLKLTGVFFTAIIIVGCGGPFPIFRPMATTLPSTTPTAGTLIHVVGWSGPGSDERKFLNALRVGGCPMAMETFDWTGGQRCLTALWRAQHSDQPAHELTQRIETVWALHPDEPISLTADSSGCGVALSAIASLPISIHVHTLVIASPALSPAYNLHPALTRIDHQIISFNSDRDFLILCLGTTLFGTTDGHHSHAAGRVGFDVAPDDPEYSKLRQIPYDPAWKAACGNNGGHSKALTPAFAKSIIAPMLEE